MRPILLRNCFLFFRKKTSAPYPYDKRKKQLQKLISTNQKIEAVKRVTQLTGAGLHLSKDYVDHLT